MIVPVAPPPLALRSAVFVADGVSTEFARECIKLFAEVVQVFGVPKSVGQIYGLLFASPAPLSFSDIVERLDISKGSASQGLKLLRSLGAVNVVRPLSLAPRPSRLAHNAPVVSIVEPSRREYFEPELGLRRLVNGVLQERVTPLATTGGNRLSHLRELAERDGEGSDFFLDRVKQLDTWRRRLKTVLPVLSMLLGPKSRR